MNKVSDEKIKTLQRQYYQAQGTYLLTDCCDSMREAEGLEMWMDNILLSDEEIDDIIKPINDELECDGYRIVRKGKRIEEEEV